MTFIHRNERNRTARWYFERFREILLRDASPCVVSIDIFKRSWHLVVVNLLLSLGLSLLRSVQVSRHSIGFYEKIYYV